MPIAAPGTIICLGLNYVEHIREGGYDIPDYPALFMRGRSSLMAAGAPMVRPACSDQLDYEAELMLIIGRGGRHIPEDRALEHVFGYTAFNDGSVRNYQRKTHQWTPGKNFDSTGAIGPCVVTPDELPEGASGLRIESRVGEEGCRLQPANMIWRRPANHHHLGVTRSRRATIALYASGCRAREETPSARLCRARPSRSNRRYRHLRQSGCRRDERATGRSPDKDGMVHA